MAAITVSKTNTDASQVKDNQKDLKDATRPGDLDTILENVKKIDNTCCFLNCKTRTTDIAIRCKHCNLRFCTAHGLPEIHGCGEAVRREEKRKYLHPEPKLPESKKEQASTKLSMKLKQMELARKSKQGFKNKSKK